MIIPCSDKGYPALLRQTKGAPKQLYYKGAWDRSLFKNCLAVVGSRRLTSYGRRAVEEVVGAAASAGITIVSGFMYGGDAAAHEAAVKAGGRTIAVMPCGIELVHPGYQRKLYHDILDNSGLVISEYAGKMKPALWTYPQRNRIVAGLSQAILVIEAGLKSGSLITAEYGRKFNRKIFALPGPITSTVSQGTNLLIKQGAEIVLGGEDILKYFHIYRARRFAPRAMSGQEKQILQELEREPLTADELARNLNFSASELGVKLSFMQMQRLISQEGNKYYINN